MRSWWTIAEPIVEQFLDTAEVAAQTARMSLSPVVLEMRQIQREYERETQYDECNGDIYFRLSSAMGMATDGFTSFMGEDEIVSQAQLMLGAQYFWEVNQFLRAHSIFSDIRMEDAALFIWGGDSPNAATATWLAYTSTPTPVLLPATVYGVRVSSGTVILREGAGTDYGSLGSVAPDTRMAILGRDTGGDWLNVQLPDGRLGWVLTDQVILLTP